MAKKFVRGITDVKTINNQDFDTNNVNDLLSDGQYNYIHRKKGKDEEYHNLTDNIKTISSDNTDLLAVTNNNKTTNTATLHPKHDKQKEQVIESTRNTVTIQHGENGTAEKTTVDTNPQKVLEHENLKTGDGLTTSFNTDETTIMFKATKKPPETNLNTLGEGVIRGRGFSIDQLPPNEGQDTSAAYITINTESNTKVQLYIRESRFEYGKIRLYYRFIKNDEVTEWRQIVGDSLELNELLEQKQNTLTPMGGISITGDSISLTAIDNYSEDLNNLTYTCTVKPIDNTPNLPTGAYAHGILTVKRIGNVVSQQYHTYDNMLYTRTARYADGASASVPSWTQWVKVTTTAV